MSDQSSKRFNKEANTFLRNVWGKRVLNLPIPEIDWSKPVRQEEIQYLLTHYPFLQILSSEPHFPENIVPKFITSISGWKIHDYEAAMSASPGAGLFGPGNPEEESEEGGSGGKGTIIKQQFDTAQQMIVLAIEKGWPGVEIIAGTPLMQWAAWMAAEDRQYRLLGYEPSTADRQKRERIKRVFGSQIKEIQPTIGPGKKF